MPDDNNRRHGGRRTLIPAMLLACLLSLAASPAAAIEETAADDISAYVGDAVDRYAIPGAALVLVEDGQKVVAGNWGTAADGSAVTTDTPFLIGSLSKPLTALAVMLLVQDGAVGLDDPVETYLPGFEYSSAEGGPVTVAHLLQQTSGIGAWDSLDVTDRNYPAADGISQAVDRLSGVQLESRPGERYEYASANYLLLGAVIESATGEPFAGILTERVFAPLGMTHTFAAAADAREAGYQPGHQSWFGHPLQSSTFHDSAGAPYGYMISTANDLAAFLTFMQTGGELLDGEELALLKTPPAEARSYGYGWRHDAAEGFLFHGGATPHSRAEMFLDLEGGVSGVLLTNKYHSLEDQQVSTVMAGIRAISQGAEPGELPDQRHPAQWVLAALVLAALLLLVRNIRHLRICGGGHSRPLLLVMGILLALVSVGLIPLLTFAMGTPWHSIRLFAPDMALLVCCLGVALAANAVVLLARRPVAENARRGPRPVPGMPEAPLVPPARR